ncbi:MAG TPA: amidohydrolase family protein [Acidimicrobiales bacterium]|nr:amidohydrolase family protein [Acidimicrobiales bacterium]
MSELVIDADGHVVEDLPWIVERVPEALREFAPKLLGENDGHVSYKIEGRIWRSKWRFPGGLRNHNSAGGKDHNAGTDPVERLAVLDSEGIDAAVLFPSSGLLFHLYETADVVDHLCRAYNDWLAKYCSADPTRLAGVALLPQQSPTLAARELERAVTEHKFVGGMLRPNRIAGRTVDHPDFDVVWATAARLDVPIGFHESTLSGLDTIGSERLNAYAGSHVSSHLFENMMAMLVTTLAGLTERFPGLRLGFLECNCGWAPTWVDRIEEHYHFAPDDFLGGDPKGKIDTRSWLTFELEEPGLLSTLQQGFEDNLMFASDYPHFDAYYPGAVKYVRDRLQDATLEDKVLGQNALAFYGPRLEALVAPLRSR